MMKEADYILATHVARVMAANQIVRDIMPGFDGVILDEEYSTLLNILNRWQGKLFKKINAKNSQTLAGEVMKTEYNPETNLTGLYMKTTTDSQTS